MNAHIFPTLGAVLVFLAPDANVLETSRENKHLSFGCALQLPPHDVDSQRAVPPCHQSGDLQLSRVHCHSGLTWSINFHRSIEHCKPQGHFTSQRLKMINTVAHSRGITKCFDPLLVMKERRKPYGFCQTMGETRHCKFLSMGWKPSHNSGSRPAKISLPSQP